MIELILPKSRAHQTQLKILEFGFASHFLTREEFESREMDDLDKKYYAKSRSAERTRQNGFYRWLTQQNKKRWKDEGVIDE